MMRPSMLGTKNHNGPASVKKLTADSGPPDWPFNKKLTFEEWFDSRRSYLNTLNAVEDYPMTVRELMQDAWRAAQGEKL